MKDQRDAAIKPNPKLTQANDTSAIAQPRSRQKPSQNPTFRKANTLS